jgi:nitrate/TMAO reductase-like tetraheme cytochrome c subunit
MHCSSKIILAVILAAIVSLANASELSEKEFKEAKKIYLAKCAKCHEFYSPADYSKSDWNAWMVKMRKKSKLKPEQFDLVQRYTETLRQSGTTSSKK